MSFQFTRSELLAEINSGILGKIGLIASKTDFANTVARDVASEVNLLSMRRGQNLVPNLFSGVYKYAAPTDLKSSAIIDIPAQAKRFDGSFVLVPSEQFSVNPQRGNIAISSENGIKQLLVYSEIQDVSQIVSTLESVTSGGTWTAFGDATNLDDDGDDYVNGSGSISFDISAAAGTTAGITSSDLNSFDITDFLDGNSSLFVYTKINSITGITNFTLRIGSSSGDYYTKTTTSQHDGTSFVQGWNLLKFDLTSLSETGSVVDTQIDFCALYMTKDTTKVSETDYKFNYAVIKRGLIHKVIYQSNYPWVSPAGVYLLKSTSDSDLIAAYPEEYKLFVLKGISLGRRRSDFSQGDIKLADDDYNDALKKYIMENPDEVKTTISEYHTYG